MLARMWSRDHSSTAGGGADLYGHFGNLCATSPENWESIYLKPTYTTLGHIPKGCYLVVTRETEDPWSVGEGSWGEYWEEWGGFGQDVLYQKRINKKKTVNEEEKNALAMCVVSSAGGGVKWAFFWLCFPVFLIQRLQTISRELLNIGLCPSVWFSKLRHS